MPDLQCGDVVVIVDSALPRNSWPRGEVMTVYPGPDGRTATGLLKRPSSKVVRLVSRPLGAIESVNNTPSSSQHQVIKENIMDNRKITNAIRDHVVIIGPCDSADFVLQIL
ncbi:unnamed protein product [Danaus chrysippus]|uniref:(African queen) hypothetical protein n=1 Tax=Danaus chrysippus TaxID=151541 RepID=A0A8J2R1Q7_9NEOP|nr:unnamed protein product [Danaus chrysippus]